MAGRHLRLLEAHPTDSGEAAWEERQPARFDLRGRTLLVVVGCLAFAAALCIGRPVRHVPEPQYIRVTVAAGDTLWELARRHGDPHGYTPEMVSRIRAANGLRSSRLDPGQELLIPVGEGASLRWKLTPVLAHSSER